MTGLDLNPSSTPTAARRLLFRDTAGTETPGDVVQWWERRRVPFNIAVGATGVLSLAFLGVLGAIGPLAHHGGGPPLLAVVAYAVLANVAYTAGWVTELTLRPVFGTRTGTVGATLFRYGLAFAVGVTAVPIPVAVLDFAIRVVRWAVGGG